MGWICLDVFYCFFMIFPLWNGLNMLERWIYDSMLCFRSIQASIIGTLSNAPASRRDSKKLIESHGFSIFPSGLGPNSRGARSASVMSFSLRMTESNLEMPMFLVERCGVHVFMMYFDSLQTLERWEMTKHCAVMLQVFVDWEWLFV